jgi:hypothetical protein
VHDRQARPEQEHVFRHRARHERPGALVEQVDVADDAHHEHDRKGRHRRERGAFFDNDNRANSLGRTNDQVTYLKPGALSGQNPKFIAKPVSQFPQGSFELMQFANQSLRDVSGVNVEILGMQNSAGPGRELDLQRKQSALTILQPLFDSLRRYRKEQGRLMLYLIEHYLPTAA